MKTSWTRNCKPCISSHLLLIKSLSQSVSPWNPVLTLVLQVSLVFVCFPLSDLSAILQKTFIFPVISLLGGCQYNGSFPFPGKNTCTLAQLRALADSTPGCTLPQQTVTAACLVGSGLSSDIVTNFISSAYTYPRSSEKILSLLFWWSSLPLCIPALTHSIFFIPRETGLPFKAHYNLTSQDQYQDIDLHHQLDFPVWFCSAVKYFILR